MYRYTYKITCTAGKFKDYNYYGCHKTANLDDGYKGSGKKLIDYYKKHPNDFIKEIVGFYDNDEDMFNAEYELIHPHLGEDKCLNYKEGGKGGSYKGINKGIKHSAEWNKKTSDNEWLKHLDNPKYTEVYIKWRQSIKEVNSNPEKARNHSKIMKEYYKDHYSPMKGYIYSEEQKQIISNSLKEYYKNNGHPLTGRKQSEETKKKNSESHKKQKYKWMTDGIDDYQVSSNNWGEFIDIGFRFGRTVGIKRGEDHPMYGKHHSKESKLKISNTKLSVKNNNEEQ